MKTKTFTFIIIALSVIGCSKEKDFTTQVNGQNNSAATVTTDNIPINDLGTGKFKGYTGGLYPNGQNDASGMYAIDLFQTCHNITPLDTFGNPSPQKGKVLFISMGWSTCAQNMRALQAKTTGNPLTNPKLLLLTCNNGAGTARVNNIMNPNDPYWKLVAKDLRDANSSFRQVQIIYLETEDSSKNTSFPGRPLEVKNDLQSCFRVFEQKFPNIKLVYLLARTTTFGNHDHIFNLEPCPYYFGWACKWAIEDQINGVEGTAYKGANKVSPMITWGFYQWATSTPRITDGFKWTADLTQDGMHANDAGRDTLSTRFQNFLLTDKYAKNWYGK